ncbi:MAG: hypothetical protein QOI74_550 [Micromonosporaceae bacterium]|nr:hypothetical protein [Micromonosporaceae bacterium]MDT5034966.1 hypothetical protein [Micromonosporaceae bacterium]
MSALVGLLTGALSALVLPGALAPLVAWDVAAITYLVWVWHRIWRLDAEATAADAVREDPTRAAADALLLSAAMASLLAVGYVLVRAGSGGGLQEGLQVGLGVASVLISWAVTHTVFALRYASLFYTGPDGGIDFHQKDPPQFSDFAYLAFTVGMTFQVSDTELNTPPIRAQVLRHSLLAYLFGTVIVALTINLVAGLTK